MTEQQHRLIERLGLDPDDNAELLEGFSSGPEAVSWFLFTGWPKDWEDPTSDDIAALTAYAAQPLSAGWSGCALCGSDAPGQTLCDACQAATDRIIASFEEKDEPCQLTTSTPGQDEMTG